MSDAAAINHNIWERSFLLRRAKNLLRIGDLASCENDCILLIKKSKAINCDDLILVRGKLDMRLYYIKLTWLYLIICTNKGFCSFICSENIRLCSAWLWFNFFRKIPFLICMIFFLFPFFYCLNFSSVRDVCISSEKEKFRYWPGIRPTVIEKLSYTTEVEHWMSILNWCSCFYFSTPHICVYFFVYCVFL